MRDIRIIYNEERKNKRKIKVTKGSITKKAVKSHVLQTFYTCWCCLFVSNMTSNATANNFYGTKVVNLQLNVVSFSCKTVF